MNELKAQLLLINKSTTNEMGCWIWSGAKSDTGYGSVRFDDKVYNTHRLAYQAFRGQIPEGHVVCHRCDQRDCCNPAHLFLGTQKANMEDAMAKGRMKGLSEDRIAEIKELLAADTLYLVIQERTAASIPTISAIARGKIGFHVRMDLNDSIESNVSTRRNRTGEKSSRFRGVSFHKQPGKWRAVCKIKKRHYSLGLFWNEAEAGIAYDAKATELLGDQAKLNFPK